MYVCMNKLREEYKCIYVCIVTFVVNDVGKNKVHVYVYMYVCMYVCMYVWLYSTFLTVPYCIVKHVVRWPDLNVSQGGAAIDGFADGGSAEG